jgi:hypothetical protein
LCFVRRPWAAIVAQGQRLRGQSVRPVSADQADDGVMAADGDRADAPIFGLLPSLRAWMPFMRSPCASRRNFPVVTLRTRSDAKPASGGEEICLPPAIDSAGRLGLDAQFDIVVG